MTKDKHLVYSTDPTTQAGIQQQLRQQADATLHKIPNDGIVRIHRETKGRGGKGVSIITGLPLRDDELKELAKKIKQHCGTGGTVKGSTIEIQGDQREKIKALLATFGYNAKLAGG